MFSLLDELPALVYVKSASYTIHFANRFFRERFGNHDGRPCYEVIHGRPSPCELCGGRPALESGETAQWEWTFEDGASFQIYDYPLFDRDTGPLVLQLGIDITSRKRAEANLEQANADLQAMTRAEREQRRFAEGLAKAVLALNSSLDWTEVLARILEQILRVIPCRAATVLLLQDDLIYLARQRGIEAQQNDLAHWRSGIPLSSLPAMERSLHDSRPWHIPDVMALQEQLPTLAPPWLRSLAAVPMVHGDDVIGLIVLLSDEKSFFTEQCLTRLEAFASHAAVAVRNAQLFEEMRKGREQLQQLSWRLVEVQEDERRYIARELHDEAGQALTSLMIQLKLLQRQSADPAVVAQGTAELLVAVEGLMENLHRLAVDLRPASLDHVGLVAALEQHCQALSRQHCTPITLEASGLKGRLPAEVETALYRIIQEALSNALRHAKPSQIRVALRRRGERIVATVEDDGQGFDAAESRSASRLGLAGMRERAEGLGGSLGIQSSKKAGTSITVEVPHDRQDPHRR